MSRVFIVDDHAMLRASLRALLERQPGVTVCGEAASAAEAIEQTVRAEPDVVLVDVRLPDLSGIELVRLLHQQRPALVMAMLSGHAEHSYVTRALAAGARGYILKGNAAELLEAVAALGRGERFVSRELADPEP